MLATASRATGGPVNEAAPFQTIWALDLTTRPHARGLWRPGAALPEDEVPAEPGRASPLGFWLIAGAAERAFTPGSRRLRVYAPGGEPPQASLPSEFNPAIRARPTQSVKVKGADGDLYLTINSEEAFAVATEGAWRGLAEPVALAVCLYWRFQAIDEALDRLTHQARGDLDHATLPGPSTVRQGKRLAEVARGVRALLVDLPYFQGPLTDPMPYVSSERSAKAFQDLAERLRLDEWCEAIDERAEVVEDTYEALTEKLFEYKNFAWEAILETIIIVILIAELTVMVVDYLTP